VGNALELFKNSHDDNMTAISDALGFYNLSHFIHDFKALCSFTPQEYCNIMIDFNQEQQTVGDNDSRNLIR